METPREYVGSYKVRTGSHNESVIHVPKKATGEFAMYANKDYSVIVLMKQLPLNVKRLARDLGKAASEPSAPWGEAKVRLDDIAGA